MAKVPLFDYKVPILEGIAIFLINSDILSLVRSTNFFMTVEKSFF